MTMFGSGTGGLGVGSPDAVPEAASLAQAVLQARGRAAGRAGGGRGHLRRRPAPRCRRRGDDPVARRLASAACSPSWCSCCCTSLDELEAASLAVLAPNIRDTFGVSDGVIVFISAAVGAFLVLGALPMGWLADRFRRGRSSAGRAAVPFLAMAPCGLAIERLHACSSPGSASASRSRARLPGARDR